ncbi:MAG: SpoIIE family protein phosphatase [Clostridia bacterium]|nr:SpoIIE family protein phosphatase [Clostridia bacterium]
MKELKGTEITLMPRISHRRQPEPGEKFAPGEFLVRVLGFFLARAVPIPGIAPFGIAFLAMERRFSLPSLFSLLMVALGYLSLAEGEMLLYIGVAVAYQGILFFLDNHRETGLKTTLIAAVMVTVFFDVFRMFWTGIGFGSLGRVLLNGALVALGTVVFDRCRGLMKGRQYLAAIPAPEEKLALCILCGIGLLSFQGIPLPFPFSIANVLGVFALGIAGISGGMLMGAIAGLAVGLVLGLKGGLLTCLAVFGCCGLAGGLNVRLGKYGAATAIAAVGVVLSVYGVSIGCEEVWFYEILPGALALVLLPERVFSMAGRFWDFGFSHPEETQVCREQIQDRLTLAADSFDNLAKTFVQISDKQDQLDLQDITQMFEVTAEQVCSHCSRVKECWQRNFNATYKTMFWFLQIMEHKGILEPEDAGTYFHGRCLRPEALAKEFNRRCEIYKINQVWKNKLCENRELVSQQFGGVAETLRRISAELDGGTAFDSLAAEEIACRLKNKEPGLLQVRVLQLPHGRRSVRISFQSPFDEGVRRGIPGVLKGVLGVTFLPAGPPKELESGEVLLEFYETPRLQISAGVACTGKREENGDSHMLHPLQGGKYMAVLSDGMGCGRQANRESSTIVSLLEDFMEAGFDKSVAVKLINSVMVMKSVSEAFATVDMCMIDLYTGETEFIKNGAEPSYIKRPARTETIRSASLPVGVVSQVEIETFAHKLDKGDTVVMVSDGLELKQGHEGWIRHTLEKEESDVPAQELADRMMEKALTLKGGTADDDMTVLVLKVE